MQWFELVQKPDNAEPYFNGEVEWSEVGVKVIDDYTLEVTLNKQWGRYTFLGYDPALEITCHDSRVKIKNTLHTQEYEGNPREYIRRILEENKSPVLEGLPPFTGGLVGYFSYDYMKYSEPSLKLDAEDTEGFQDVDLMLFDKVIAFDNYRQKIVLVVNAKTDALECSYNKAMEELKYMADLIRNGRKADIPPLKLRSGFRELFSREEYCAARTRQWVLMPGNSRVRYNTLLDDYARFETEAAASRFNRYTDAPDKSVACPTPGASPRAKSCCIT